jgi:7-carboxy-7-deazaguanine synthase (Cx14CxxC type)
VTYALKEIYYTLQGEGAHAGRAAVFARFAGCNLWSGREEDRATATCWFCDTDFVGTDGPGGGKWGDAEELAGALRSCWEEGARSADGGVSIGGGGRPYVVFTGGEPTLQLDEALVRACHGVGLEVAVETNGTREVARGVDWICVSPKPGGSLVQTRGDELKLVYPHEVQPETVEVLDFANFFLQPLDGPERARNTGLCVDYVRRHPKWRLSLQTHKLIGIP